MKIVRVQTKQEGNDLYPLPPFFFDRPMGKEDRRLWRINACRQWLLYNANSTDTPETKAALKRQKSEALVASMHFFEQHYLKAETDDDGTVVFDPFFYTRFIPTPEYHWHLCRASMAHRLVAAIGPRGSAKTYFCKKLVGLMMLSRSRFPITYSTSTNELTELFGEDVKYQLYENKRIHDDFAPEEEFSGRIKPRRGEAMSGMKGFSLSNRSTLFCTSAESRQRGGRPLKYIMDDPEWDPKHSTPMEILREWFEHLLFRVIMPMIQQPDTSFLWVGTYVSQQHYLWHATHTESITTDGITRDVPLDPRFSRWYRIIQPAEVELETPAVPPETKPRRVRLSCWPEMWPVDEEEKTRLQLPDDTRTLDDIRADIGDAAYEAEYMARPGSGVAAYFPPLTEEQHGYHFEQADPFVYTEPMLSKALLCYHQETSRGAYTEVKVPFGEFLHSCTRFVCCDPSMTASTTSDFKTALAMALSPRNELFIWDVWAERCEDDDQVSAAFLLADRYLVRVIGNENSKDGATITRRFDDIIRTRATAAAGVDHLPEHIAWAPGAISKCGRIGSLRWRFLHSLIKVRWDVQGDRSTRWPMLFNQIRGFKNLGGDDTGLANDDCIDTVAMHREIVGGLPAIMQRTLETARTPVELLKEGHTLDPRTGLPLITLTGLMLTAADIDSIMAVRTNPPTHDVTNPARARRGVA